MEKAGKVDKDWVQVNPRWMKEWKDQEGSFTVRSRLGLPVVSFKDERQLAHIYMPRKGIIREAKE